MTTYKLVNIVTLKVYGTVSTATLAGAQEYFDIFFPNTLNAVIFEIK